MAVYKVSMEKELNSGQPRNKFNLFFELEFDMGPLGFELYILITCNG